MKPTIEIQGLGKQYKIGGTQPYLSLRDALTSSIKNIFKTNKNESYIWALRDINMDIQEGERIGIIGLNGAGKTTLLKILSRITPPTLGKSIVRGRVASLLEVGTGFHQELTGRENIYLNGSILGLKKTEINRKMDAIIDFSGVEKFLETPLKHFSSGMQLRLAFSVAAHLEPEILLIDEVLAVGDIEFQKKCLGKMEEVSNKEGRTIVFVSHDLSAISTLTSKCLLLDHGKMVNFDKTQQIITQYARLFRTEKVFETQPVQNIPTVTRVELKTSESGSLQGHGKPMSIFFEINMPEADFKNLAISFQVFNHLNQPVLFDWIFDSETPICRKKGKNYLRFDYQDLILYKGDYFLRVHLAESRNKTNFQNFDCCHFTVEMIDLKEPEWGWTSGVCQVLAKGKWEIVN